MTWDEAIDRYGTDKPDLRFGMELVDLARGARRRPSSTPSRRPAVRAIVARRRRRARPGAPRRAHRAGARASARRARLDARRRGRRRRRRPRSPVAKFLSRRRARRRSLAATGAATGDLVLLVADEHRRACEVLGQLRVDLGRPPVARGPAALLLGGRLPALRGLDDDGRPVAGAPPVHDAERRGPRAPRRPTRCAVRAQSYDLVLNGWELGSGSIRIHRARHPAPGLRAPSASPTRRPRRASGSSSAPSATARRRTAASRSASTASSRSSPARTTSARSSPSRRPSPAPT